MPVAVSYPGVYIEELSSGVRTIAGVATSITAFAGRAVRGPTDADEQSPVLINGFADYERIFGGLWLDSSMSFAVRDFFRNGGTQALIVRLFNNKDTDPKPKAKITIGDLTLIAANPGSWGNQLRIRIDHDTREEEADETPDSLFNVSVRDGNTGVVEVFRNVTRVADLHNSLDKVLSNQSALIRVDGTLAGTRPAAHDVGAGKDIWADNTPATSAGVETADKADDGDPLEAADFNGSESAKTGLHALLKADLFNLLCVPPYKSDGNVDTGVITTAAGLCEKRRAFLIIDPPTGWNSTSTAASGAGDFSANLGTGSKNAAVFFPRLRMPNTERGNQEEDFAPCGAVAGIFARTDAERGVWKAPAGLDATLRGVPRLSVSLTDPENGTLNQMGVNCLRTLPGAGRVVWGSRTLRGSDRMADSEWKYVPVRRLALFLEESLYRGTTWAVFEPNDEPLWAQLRLNIGAFMHGLFRQGAFARATPSEAYFVKCDRETTTQTDINLGVVNVVIGYAPLKPAEFVVLKFQQMAGQTNA